MISITFAASCAVGLVLAALILSVGITIGHHLVVVVESRRWRSRYRIVAAESRRWRRDVGHPGGHVVYTRRPDRRTRA